jgi:antitoxin PrlF
VIEEEKPESIDSYLNYQYNQIYQKIGRVHMSCCAAAKNDQPCCKVESIVSIDERGQMVLPKDLREKANIKSGDKLAVVSYGQMNGISCLALVKVEDISNLVKQMLGPVFKEIAK